MLMCSATSLLLIAVKQLILLFTSIYQHCMVLLVHGCKKENYLLNFHYEPRNAQNRNVGKSMRNSRNSNRWLPPIQRHRYNKEQFLQASCQFVVIAGGDYSLYWTNPDVLVDWNLVEPIKVHSSENLSCPICLCPPIAGKMTRCGHVYCWPCILHYIDVSDKKNASCKCPICYATVYKNATSSRRLVRDPAKAPHSQALTLTRTRSE